jgi:cellulose synthase/poly-beta-1,6-N-acetylglucosamine synthase-like glycosyltransferase
MSHFVFGGIIRIYEWIILIYCSGIFISYTFLSFFAFLNIRKNIREKNLKNDNIIEGSPLTPGISIVAPAYNEAATIIFNVRSLLTLNYPLFEVIIVNDGSKDNTLEKLIEEFRLVEIDYAYNPRLASQPVKRFFKSESRAYSKLLVIDKINGKSKADAVNAGINATTYPLLLNTDVDCILDRDTLYNLVQPFIEETNRVIATGAALRAANSCIVDSGLMQQVIAPRKLLPRFQELEYTRSFILGKMGWSYINAISNVSGGLGLFDKEILINAGGYDPVSFGEDMDMIVKMSRYMCDIKEPYSIRYVPQVQCWTEVPQSMKVFSRQRMRWARGLLQIFIAHRDILFNPKYRRLGLIVFPYNFFFELLAPLIEVIGLLFYIYLLTTQTFNWTFTAVLLLFTYLFSVFITTFSIFLDQLVNKSYSGLKEIFGLCFTALLEPFLYHPLGLYFSLKGYFNHLAGRSHQWGNMQRKGFIQQTDTAVIQSN